MLHPRVVDLRDAQPLHQPDGQHRDVAGHGLALDPADHLDGGRVGLLDQLDTVGERGQILRFPAGARGDGQVSRRRQAQRARPVHEPGDVAGQGRVGVQPGPGDQVVEVPHLGLQCGDLGLRRLRRDPPEHRCGHLQPAVQHAAAGHLDAEEDLLVRHRKAHQVALLTLQEAVPAERPRHVRQPPQRVVVERLGPQVHRVWPGGHPHMQPATLQLTELGGDLADQQLALGVAAEAPRLRPEPVPGHHLPAGAGEVPVDGAQRNARLVLRPGRSAGQRPASTGLGRPGRAVGSGVGTDRATGALSASHAAAFAAARGRACAASVPGRSGRRSARAR